MLYLWISSNMYFCPFASMNEIFRYAISMIYFTTHRNNGKFRIYILDDFSFMTSNSLFFDYLSVKTLHLFEILVTNTNYLLRNNNITSYDFQYF